jgi:hypothetical protein
MKRACNSEACIFLSTFLMFLLNGSHLLRGKGAFLLAGFAYGRVPHLYRSGRKAQSHACCLVSSAPTPAGRDSPHSRVAPVPGRCAALAARQCHPRPCRPPTHPEIPAPRRGASRAAAGARSPHTRASNRAGHQSLAGHTRGLHPAPSPPSGHVHGCGRAGHGPARRTAMALAAHLCRHERPAASGRATRWMCASARGARRSAL